MNIARKTGLYAIAAALLAATALTACGSEPEPTPARLPTLKIHTATPTPDLPATIALVAAAVTELQENRPAVAVYATPTPTRPAPPTPEPTATKPPTATPDAYNIPTLAPPQAAILQLVTPAPVQRTPTPAPTRQPRPTTTLRPTSTPWPANTPPPTPTKEPTGTAAPTSTPGPAPYPPGWSHHQDRATGYRYIHLADTNGWSLLGIGCQPKKGKEIAVIWGQSRPITEPDATGFDNRNGDPLATGHRVYAQYDQERRQIQTWWLLNPEIDQRNISWRTVYEAAEGGNLADVAKISRSQTLRLTTRFQNAPDRETTLTWDLTGRDAAFEYLDEVCAR